MPGAGRSELIEALKGHVVAVAVLTGTYQRHEGGDEFGEDWDEADDFD
jgi:hypothetical protein